jgi:predicted O-methyltransferase YrrM
MKSPNNPLTAYFENNKNGKLIHKWLHYFDVYNAHFARFVDQPMTIVEFGVAHGGSLEMWRHYFGKRARIIGVDINPECLESASRSAEVYLADQDDPDSLRKLAETVGQADIVIDDGGHTTRQQLNTFEVFYPLVKTPGVYLVEDLHTNYWHEFGGGLRQQGTFIEHAKQLIDQLNAWHSRDAESLKVDDFTQTTRSMHFYDSIIAFTKEQVVAPSHRQIGRPTLSNLQHWDYRSVNQPGQ